MVQVGGEGAAWGGDWDTCLREGGDQRNRDAPVTDTWGNRCDTLGSFPPPLRLPPTSGYTSTRFLMSWLQWTGLGIFSKVPSRCPSITLVTAMRGSGKGPFCSPRSLGTCLPPAVPPLAWVAIVVWVHGAPRVTEHGKASGPRALMLPRMVWLAPAQALLPLPGVEAAGGQRVPPSSERAPPQDG